MSKKKSKKEQESLLSLASGVLLTSVLGVFGYVFLVISIILMVLISLFIPVSQVGYAVVFAIAWLFGGWWEYTGVKRKK